MNEYREQLLEAMEIIIGTIPEGEDGTMFGCLNQLLAQAFMAHLSAVVGEQEGCLFMEASPVDFALYLVNIAQGRPVAE